MSEQVELLSNIDIEEISREFNIPLVQCTNKTNLRIAPRSNIPCGYVINLDDFAGSHWVALFCYRGHAIYCDSYGQHSPNAVTQFCKKHHLKKFENLTQIQSLESTACGYYCLYFLWYMTKHLPKIFNEAKLKAVFFQYIEPFDSDNQKGNDAILQSLIRSQMGRIETKRKELTKIDLEKY